MADDNVVRPNFGKKDARRDRAESTRRDTASLRNFVRASAGDTWAGKFRIETPEGDTTDSERDADMKGFATVLGAFDIQKVLDRLAARHEGKIHDLKSLVQSYSDEELQSWLANPADSDLQRKPNFFHALIDEAKKRFLGGIDKS